MIYNANYIFVHVPKTGGLSVNGALGGRHSSLSMHTPLRCVPKGNRFAFGFIRNPWARMVSLYRFLCQKNIRPTDNFNQQAVREMGFVDWLMTDQFIMAEDLNPGARDLIDLKGWSNPEAMQRRPQMWWLEGCDYIGKFEDFPNSFEKACSLGHIHHRPLPHRNKTTGPDWRSEYTQEAIDFVEEYFRKDIDFGGYSFNEG